MADALIHTTPSRTFSFVRYGPLALQAKALPGAITDAEWNAYVELCRRDRDARGTAPLVLQHVASPGPSPAQLQRLSEVMAPKGLPRRSATVGDSAILRSNLVSLRWHLRANVEVRTYAPGLERDALAWLAEDEPFDVDDALALLQRCVEEVRADD